jgi:hypothetical protein
MYQLLRESGEEETEVVRSMEEARRWLGLPEE